MRILPAWHEKQPDTLQLLPFSDLEAVINLDCRLFMVIGLCLYAHSVNCFIVFRKRIMVSYETDMTHCILKITGKIQGESASFKV